MEYTSASGGEPVRSTMANMFDKARKRRAAVRRMLEQGPLTAKELHERLQAQGYVTGLTSVYSDLRNLAAVPGPLVSQEGGEVVRSTWQLP